MGTGGQDRSTRFRYYVIAVSQANSSQMASAVLLGARADKTASTIIFATAGVSFRRKQTGGGGISWNPVSLLRGRTVAVVRRVVQAVCLIDS